MKLGIKVSAKKSSIDDLNATNPAMAEVWYNANEPDMYTELFDNLKQRKIDVGLHFWAVLTDNMWTNVAYPDDELVKGSMDLMRQTINAAALNGFQYVNVHPGTAAKVQLYFDKEEFVLAGKSISFVEAEKLFLSNFQKLSDYARKHGIVLTVETVPSRVTYRWRDSGPRKVPMNVYELPASVVQAAANQNLAVANDFGHTAANVISDNPIDVWEFLKKTTVDLAPATKLIHLGFVTEPFNGTDFHDMLDNPLLETDRSVPNRNQMIELLKLFKDRDDVWILTEPREDHVKNYFLAKKIIEQALKT